MNLGGTIGELQERMSRDEFDLWCAYRRKNGPMNDARRFDRPGAQTAYMVNRMAGGKGDFKDFMPLYGKNEQQAAPTLDEVVQAFGGMVKIG